jgi:hypothetical protein
MFKRKSNVTPTNDIGRPVQSLMDPETRVRGLASRDDDCVKSEELRRPFGKFSTRGCGFGQLAGGNQQAQDVYAEDNRSENDERNVECRNRHDTRHGFDSLILASQSVGPEQGEGMDQ